MLQFPALYIGDTLEYSHEYFKPIAVLHAIYPIRLDKSYVIVGKKSVLQDLPHVNLTVSLSSSKSFIPIQNTIPKIIGETKLQAF